MLTQADTQETTIHKFITVKLQILSSVYGSNQNFKNTQVNTDAFTQEEAMEDSNMLLSYFLDMR